MTMQTPIADKLPTSRAIAVGLLIFLDYIDAPSDAGRVSCNEYGYRRFGQRAGEGRFVVEEPVRLLVYVLGIQCNTHPGFWVAFAHSHTRVAKVRYTFQGGSTT